MLCQSTFVSCQKRFQASVCNGTNAHPKLSVETATQLAIFLANRPGALARVCDALANAGVNIYALATSDTVDHTVVRMVVSNPTKR
jgi:prephenate dehydratase